MKRITLTQVLVFVATLVTLAVNALANILPFNGQTTGAISDRFQVYFTPAGYVFAIWGVIYLGLLFFSVYQLLPSQAADPVLGRVRILYLISALANCLWIFLWHYNQLNATGVVMLVLLLSLVAIYLILGIGHVGGRAESRWERWLVHLPFSIYLGWISVATIADWTAILWNAGWNGGSIGPQIWTVLMMLAATTLTVLMLTTRRDLAYALVSVWALAGIAYRQPTVWGVSIPAGLFALGLLVLGVWLLFVRRPGEMA
jgi:translocator protein